MTKDIAESIRTKTCLKIFYEPGERLVEPHTLGIGSDGQYLLRAFQVAGASASGEHKDWKLFRVDRMRLIGGSGGASMAPRPGYKRNDKAMKGGIIEEI